MTATAKTLSLDFLKDNSQENDKKAAKRGCHIGFFQGVYRKSKGVLGGIRINLPCDKWSCEYCRARKIKQLKKRCMQGAITEYAMKKGFRSKYSYKMLTLTVPGKSYRERYTPQEALEHLSKNFDKLIRALKEKYGKEFHYLRVVEPQPQNGYPHYHVLMVGHAIATKTIYKSIENLWIKKYHMGFFWLDVLKYGLGGGINYVMKYLTKEIKQIKPNSRIFTASKGALMKKDKKKWIRSEIYIGTVRGEGENVRVYETKLDDQLSNKILRKEIEAFFNEVMGDGIKAPF